MSGCSAIAVSSRPVLVLDDDPAVRSSLKFSLEVEGFAVRDYSRASELLEDMQASQAACIVLDYHLPEMNGLDMLARLRAQHVAVPAVMITTNPSIAVRQRAAAAGVPIVEKPLLGNALVESIRCAMTSCSQG